VDDADIVVLPAQGGFVIEQAPGVRSTPLADPLVAASHLVSHVGGVLASRSPARLGLHAAAVEAGGLALLLGAEGSGKSVLAAAALLAGRRLFADDKLLLELDRDVTGIALGRAMKLRNPLPACLGGPTRDRSRRALDARTTFESETRLYLTPAAGELAAFGARAPVAALVLLDRAPGATPALAAATAEDAAAALTPRLFAPNRPPAAREELAARLADRVPPYRLRYDDPDAAASVLIAALTAR